VWYYQTLFFRRYGLQDLRTIVLNAALLFTVLFYVYPLKFLFSFVSMANSTEINILPHEFAQLMLMYCAGFCLIFGVFAFMYKNAAKNAETLSLTPQEVFETHTYISWAFVGVGIFVIILAQIVPNNLSGAMGAF
jgi:hypothetical protein